MKFGAPVASERSICDAAVVLVSRNPRVHTCRMSVCERVEDERTGRSKELFSDRRYHCVQMSVVRLGVGGLASVLSGM